MNESSNKASCSVIKPAFSFKESFFFFICPWMGKENTDIPRLMMWLCSNVHGKLNYHNSENAFHAPTYP